MADTKQTAGAKAKAELQKIEVVVVKSVAAGFRRLGIAFTREAQHLDARVLSDEQRAALHADPNLVVTTDTVTVAAPGTPTHPVVTPVAVEDSVAGEAK